jgi:hypothetical protein
MYVTELRVSIPSIKGIGKMVMHTTSSRYNQNTVKQKRYEGLRFRRRRIRRITRIPKPASSGNGKNSSLNAIAFLYSMDNENPKVVGSIHQ